MPLFSPSDKAELLSEDALAHDRLGVLLETVELRLVDLYREQCRCRTGPIGTGWWGRSCQYDCESESEVRLRGWAEENGQPDYDAMDAQLKRALQLTVARVVNRLAEQPLEHLKRSERGDRTEVYRDPGADIRRSDTALLRPYDEREPLYSL